MAAKKQKSVDLTFTCESGWKSLKKRDEKALHRFCEEYRQFLSTAKTEREANDEGVALCESKGFTNFEDAIKAGKQLQPGEKYYYSIAGKTLMAFIIGKRPIIDGMRLVGGHTDSPRLDLKPRPLFEDGGMALLDTHYYGGVKKYQWVTTPLAIHGVVVKKDGSKQTIVIGEDPGDPVFVISDLLPHLGKDQAQKKLSEAIPGEALDVVVGSIPDADPDAKDAIKLNILKLLHSKYGIDETDLTSAEISLVPAGPARNLGLDNSMLLGYGHDDRVCAYTALRGLTDQKSTPEYTSLALLCDKEEIGSVGSTGMYTFLFENAVAEIVNLLPHDGNADLTLRRCLRHSKMLSADVNALHDPNFKEVSSPNGNMGMLNHGIILTKYVGARGKSGSNDAHAEYVAEIRKIWDDAGVTWQVGEIGKVDQGGGGTISFMMARYEMDVVDCGPGLLSMHAPWEAAGKFDIFMTYKAFCAFFASK